MKDTKVHIKRLFLILLLPLFLVVSCNQEEKAVSAPPFDPFPLEKGNSWIYQGEVKWTEVPDKVFSKNISWNMEVLDTITRGHLFAAVVKGHPSDLSWYEEGQKPGDYLIIRVGESKYYILDQPRAGEAIKRLKDMDDFLGNIVTENDLFLEYPVKKGDVFGEAAQLTRPDMSYFWFVESVEKIKPEGIKGLASEKELQKYVLTFQSAPDHQIVGFIPGVGISSFTYVHHGTVAETHLKLVEFKHASKEAGKKDN